MNDRDNAAIRTDITKCDEIANDMKPNAGGKRRWSQRLPRNATALYPAPAWPPDWAAPIDSARIAE